MHLVQIIGEAASKVTPETKEASPHIPWVCIIGMRHRLVHDYLRIDTARVWEVARNDLPSLIAAVQPLVPPEV